MKDQYSWLENAEDPRVVRWALSQDRVARESVKQYSDTLFRRLVPFYQQSILRSVQLTKRGIILFFSDDESYKLQLLHNDGERELIVDSAKLGKNTVIQAAQAREDGKRLALHFSQGGSDEGTVEILDLETTETVDTLQGFIGDVLWTRGESYYYVRTSRTGKTPDGVEPPADRVYFRAGEKEEMCFGKGLPTNTFIELFGSRDHSHALLNVYNGFSRCRPYGGRIDTPESWIPVYPETDTIVSNIDYVGGKHLLLSFEKSCGEVLLTGERTTRLVRESRWPLLEAAVV